MCVCVCVCVRPCFVNAIYRVCTRRCRRYGTPYITSSRPFYRTPPPLFHAKGQFGRGNDCTDCPEGATCPGGYRLWAVAGWWTPAEDAGYVGECFPAASCEGGRSSACAEGYEGEYCGQCIAGYTR